MALPNFSLFIRAAGVLLLLGTSLLAQAERLNEFPVEQDKKNAILIDGKDVSLSTKLTMETNERLDEFVDFSFDETPFRDFTRLMQDFGVNIKLDQTAIDDSLTNDDTITFEMKGVPLRVALKQILKEKNATFMIQSGVLHIISLDVAGDPEFFVRRVYDVRKLLEAMRQENPANLAMQDLHDLICNSVAPDDWVDTNGDGTLNIVAGRLVVVQSQDNVDDLDDFLKDFAFEVMGGKKRKR